MSYRIDRNASRETSFGEAVAPAPVGPLMIQVGLPASHGASRVGDMVPGKAYELPADEAIRLVEAKGFQYVTDADAQLAATHREQLHAAALAQAEVAAAAAGEGGGTPLMHAPE